MEKTTWSELSESKIRKTKTKIIIEQSFTAIYQSFPIS